MASTSKEKLSGKIAPTAVPRAVAAEARTDAVATTNIASVAEATSPAEAQISLTKRALLERVATRTGLRKAQVRPVIEAMLAELGEALVREEVLKLQPLGVMRVVRSIEGEKADVLVCKLRRKNFEKDADAPLAKRAEEG